MSDETCACGYSFDDHGQDDEFPGSTACNACEDCVAFEADDFPDEDEYQEEDEDE